MNAGYALGRGRAKGTAWCARWPHGGNFGALRGANITVVDGAAQYTIAWPLPFPSLPRFPSMPRSTQRLGGNSGRIFGREGRQGYLTDQAKRSGLPAAGELND